MVTRPDSKKARLKRHTRVRSKISGTAECPRLDAFRSLQNIYEMCIRDRPHGGIALGPKPRDYGFDVNKKVRRLAMKSALSSKVAADEMIRCV